MIQIIKDEKDFIIINKPAGISFHKEDGVGLMGKLEEQIGEKLFAVHRLDKGTTGLILFAKNKTAASELSHLWQSRQVVKLYLAISNNKPKKKQGTITGDMEKSRRGSYKLIRTFEHPATTQFVSISLRPGHRLFLCRPYTGKTHQIRVALKSVSAPVMGDLRYTGETADRMYLHSYALKFNFREKDYAFVLKPTEGKEFLSPEFAKALDHFDDPFNIVWPKVKK
jgi:tRNA pseudouridine32 synthase/23S rRNA pseudouridine746 synthase